MTVSTWKMINDSIDVEDDTIDMKDDTIDVGYNVTLPRLRASYIADDR
jgi:hypothetical protein